MVQWDDDEARFVLDQLAKLDLYSGSSLKQQSVDFKICIIVFVAIKEWRYLSSKRQKNKRTVPKSNQKIIVAKTKYIPSTNMLSIKDSSVCMISALEK
jgi:hypothetical protein